MTGRADNDGIWIEGSATVIAGAMAAGLLQALMAGVANSAALANAVVAIQHAVAVLL